MCIRDRGETIETNYLCLLAVGSTCATTAVLFVWRELSYSVLSFYIFQIRFSSLTSPSLLRILPSTIFMMKSLCYTFYPIDLLSYILFLLPLLLKLLFSLLFSLSNSWGLFPPILQFYCFETSFLLSS